MIGDDRGRSGMLETTRVGPRKRFCRKSRGSRGALRVAAEGPCTHAVHAAAAAESSDQGPTLDFGDDSD